MKKKFRDMPLRSKMLTVILGIIVSLFIELMLLLSVLSNTYDKSIYSYAVEELDFFTQQVSRLLDNIEDFSYTLALDEDNQRTLAAMAKIPDGTADYTMSLFKWKSYILAKLLDGDYILNVHFIDTYNTDSLIGVITEAIPEEIRTDLLNKMASVPGAYVSVKPTQAFPYYLSGREIHNYLDSSMHELGKIIIVSDPEKIISKAVAEMETPHEALIVYSGDYCIYNDLPDQGFNLSIISGNQGYRLIRYNQKRYLQCWLKSEKTGWTFIDLVPYSEIYGSIMRLQILIIMIGLLTGIVLFILSARFSSMITKPYTQLTRAMHRAEDGDFAAARQMTEYTDRKDETGQLVNNFHHMMERIEILITDNYQKQLIIKETKYRMLRAQINPHFLYNTLNAINWMIRMKKNEDAGRMIVELGRLLRASFANEGFTNAAEEIENVRSYMVIQHYRYGKRIHFQIEESGNLEEWTVPIMILQPLVENSVIYGVESTAEKCSIVVSAKAENEKLVFTIDDDGPGISAEDLEKARNLTIKPKGHGIGYKNIVERLRLAYGGEAEISIDSEQGEGTHVRIMIPRKEPENVQTDNR